MKPLRHVFLLALTVSPASVLGHESPIDHVERELQLFAQDGAVRLVYRLLVTERAALMELKAMDADGDGTISAGERDAFFAAKAAAIARRIDLTIGDSGLEMRPEGGVTCDPQLGQTYRFTASLPALATGRHTGKLVDGHSRDYPGGYVWKEPGRGGPGAIRFEPAGRDTTVRSQDHPPWIELPFTVVVR